MFRLHCVQILSIVRNCLFQRRQWLFRSIVGLGLPLVLLALIEAALRLGGYGYQTTFFKTVRIGNQAYLIENDKFGLRFFSPSVARSPAPILLPARKAAGTYRIFIFGESAALGDPKPAFGAPRYLKALLQQRFPGLKFEVVCVAMTAINSHAILPIARECARYQGDLWVIYMGNNEMVGPFGAATVFGSRAPPLQSIRLALAFQKLRLGQWMMATARQIGNKQLDAEAWGGMRMFLQSQISASDPRKKTVYASFEKNLQDMIELGVKCGAKIILNEIAVNLEDCPPFASSTNAASANSPAYEKLCAAADAAEKAGDRANALRLWTEAANMNPQCAQVQFRLAESYQRCGDLDKAGTCFALARDCDALPFRADSKINSLIQTVAHKTARPGVSLCEVGRMLTPDRANFFDHVHFNFSGNYRLAKIWAGYVERLLFSSVSNKSLAIEAAAAQPSAGPGEWAGQTECDRRLGLTDWNRSAALENMAARVAAPPFSGRFNNQTYVARLLEQLGALRQTMDTGHVSRARSNMAQALAADPTDFYVHQNAAEFLERIGDAPAALEEWIKVRDLIPHHFVAYFHVGRLLGLEKRFEEADASLRHALKLQPGLAEAWIELGKLQTARGNFALAFRDFERAGKMRPHDYLPHYYLGKTLVALQRRVEGIQQVQQAIRLNPDYWEARYWLAGELAADGQLPAARDQLQEVIRLKPDYSMAYFNLGVAFFKLGDPENAKRALSEALRLDPENATLQQNLKQLDLVNANRSPNPSDGTNRFSPGK